MSHDIPQSDEQYICDNCGYTSPIANDRCPECGSMMSALHDEKPKARVMTGENEEDLAEGETGASEHEDGTLSLDDLQKQEFETDGAETPDTFGDE